MIRYIKNLYNGFINATISKKITAVALTLLYIALLLSVIVKVNVEVITPGGLNSTAYTDTTENESGSVKIMTENSAGNIYTVGVYSHIRVSYFQYLISQFSKNIDHNDYNPQTNLSDSEQVTRGKIHRNYSMNHALIVAYKEANKIDPTIYLDYDFKGLIVSAVYHFSETDLHPYDIITHINGVPVESYNHFSTLLAAASNNVSFPLTVKRHNEVKTITARKVLYQDNYLLGIETAEHYEINSENSTPKFTISEEMPSLGSSGGSMTTLAIYNALLEEDITGGKIIVGTGTINIDGTVGDIAGVSQKIVTAAMHKIDIFFVNAEDYEEAKTKCEEINAEFELIRVNTFTDIIEALAGDTE